MTCIVGLELADGGAWLAGDRFIVDDQDCRDAMAVPKIVRRGPLLLGFCAGVREGQVLEWLEAPRPPRLDEDMLRYLDEVLITPMRSTHARLGIKPSPDEFAGIVACRGTVHRIDDDGGLWRSGYGYAAIGAGSAWALGSLASTEDKPPKERLALALKAAARHSNACLEPFDYLDLEPARRTRTRRK